MGDMGLLDGHFYFHLYNKHKWIVSTLCASNTGGKRGRDEKAKT